MDDEEVNNEDVDDYLYKVLAAANYWCDYLDEWDRKEEIPPLEEAITALRKWMSY